MKGKLVAIFLGVSCLFWQLDATARGGRVLTILGEFVLGVVTGLATNQAQGAIDGEDEKEKKPQKPQNTGYQFNLTWRTHDGVYFGVLTMRGTAGEFRVTTPLGTVIDQNMLAGTTNNGDVILSGSNPRYVDTSTPAHYSPDRFRITKTPHGGWAIADTCDYQGMCAPVTVMSASEL